MVVLERVGGRDLEATCLYMANFQFTNVIGMGGCRYWKGWEREELLVYKIKVERNFQFTDVIDGEEERGFVCCNSLDTCACTCTVPVICKV